MSIKGKFFLFFVGCFCGALILYFISSLYRNEEVLDSLKINKLYTKNGKLYQDFTLMYKNGITKLGVQEIGNFKVEKTDFIPNGKFQYYGSIGHIVLLTKDLSFDEFMIKTLDGKTLIVSEKLGNIITTVYYNAGREVFLSQPSIDSKSILEQYLPIKDISYSDENHDGIWDFKIDQKKHKISFLISGAWYELIDKNHVKKDGKKFRFKKENNTYILESQ